MTDANDLVQQLGHILQQANAGGNATPMMNTAMMPAAMMGMPTAPQPTGFSVRISIPLPDGSSLSGYLHFGPELVQNPNMLPMVAQQLAASYQGLIQPYYPRQNQGGGGNWGRGGYDRGGYGGNRYGGGGYGGPRW